MSHQPRSCKECAWDEKCFCPPGVLAQAADLRGAQLLVALQGHHKFPEGARTVRLEEAVLGLKSDSPDAEKRALQMQDEVVAALAPGVDGAALEKVAIVAKPKAADVKAFLGALPLTLRQLLKVVNPEKYRCQKRPEWKKDWATALALAQAIIGSWLRKKQPVSKTCTSKVSNVVQGRLKPFEALSRLCGPCGCTTKTATASALLLCCCFACFKKRMTPS